MGMDMSERPLHRRLGLLLRLGGPAPVRTCKLQSSVMAEIRNGEGETLRVGTSDRHPKKAQTLHTQRRPFLQTLHTCSRGGMAKKHWASRSLQTRNCATGREQIPSETAGALLFLTPPAWKRLSPSNLETMKWSTEAPERGDKLKTTAEGALEGSICMQESVGPMPLPDPCVRTPNPENLT